MTISQRFIRLAPKTDLHCHLDGSLRIATFIELAQKNKIKLPSYEAQTLLQLLAFGQVRSCLEDYLTAFVPLVNVLQKEEDLQRAFYELCEDAALENVWHLEIRYCPLLHTQLGLSPKDVVKAGLRATDLASRKFNLSIGHILCGLKNHSQEDILAVAKLAVDFSHDGVVGFDLAGPEAGFPLSNYLTPINLAKNNNLAITLHAGESYGPKSIAQAVYLAKAQRIGHGTTLIQDPKLLNYIVEQNIKVEACPLSNYHTKAVDSLALHPLKKFLDLGVCVSLNTDNRLVSNTSISHELAMIITELGLELSDVYQLLKNGFLSAFVTEQKRQDLLDRFELAWQDLLRSEI